MFLFLLLPRIVRNRCALWAKCGAFECFSRWYAYISVSKCQLSLLQPLCVLCVHVWARVVKMPCVRMVTYRWLSLTVFKIRRLSNQGETMHIESWWRILLENEYLHDPEGDGRMPLRGVCCVPERWMELIQDGVCCQKVVCVCVCSSVEPICAFHLRYGDRDG
jgi:hypothetical protein